MGTDFIVLVWEDEAGHLEIDTFRICTRADSVTGYICLANKEESLHKCTFTNFLRWPSSECFIYLNM